MMKNKMRILAIICAGLLVAGCENKPETNKTDEQVAAQTAGTEAASAQAAEQQAAAPAASTATQSTGTETQALIDPAQGSPADLSTTTSELTAGPGASMTVSVMVKNTSQVAFVAGKDLAQPDDQINFVIDYLDASGKAIDTLRSVQPLPDSLAVGQSGTYQIPVMAPATAGQYTMQIDMVQQGKNYFNDMGTKPVMIAVTVK
jgi:outer membrane murein-binding lipoprotein Lpp